MLRHSGLVALCSVALFLPACVAPAPAPAPAPARASPAHRYTIVSTNSNSGSVYRLDTFTGDVVRISGTQAYPVEDLPTQPVR